MEFWILKAIKILTNAFHLTRCEVSWLKMDPYVLGCIVFVVIQIVGAVLVPFFAPKGETA